MPQNTGKKSAKGAKSNSSRSSGSKSAAKSGKGKGQTSKGSRSTKQSPVQESYRDNQALTPLQASVPYILAIVAVFLLVSMLTSDITGSVGQGIKGLFFGLFAGGSYLIPFLIVIFAVRWKYNVLNCRRAAQTVYEALLLLFFSAMLHIWTGGVESFKIAELFSNGKSLIGGGAIGGLLCSLMLKCVGIAGTYIIGIAAIIVFGVMSFGLTPYTVGLYIAYHAHEKREQLKAEKEERRAMAERENRQIKRKPNAEPYYDDEYTADSLYEKQHVRGFSPDVPVDDQPDSDQYNDGQYDGDYDDNSYDNPDLQSEENVSYEDQPADSGEYQDDTPPFDIDTHETPSDTEGADDSGATEYIKPINTGIARRGTAVEGKVSDLEASDEKIDLGAIFTDPDGVDVLQKFADAHREKDLEKQRMLAEMSADGTEADAEIGITRSPATDGQSTVAETEAEEKEYVFPPITMLNIDTSPKNEDISEELHTNAAKLVETLRSFKVRTHIVNVSRGPTITRYELAPEEGVRVRAIANLVDDISLNLATSGVRIEAPIPGKAAVGVEVPNKTVNTVYLRELIDTNAFRTAQSKTTAVLGMDVAGNPVYLDIAKMPHLLIAGATGMGKSVCINSLIVSLLYKASPDEVKLILIDPKKVELNIYNGLPHLLVPVVSDPKKSAGALHWAVTEMERRFSLIEEAGVREIRAYNAATKDDPEKEFLPHIIIIIDELAELMMQSPDDVEASICRIAQKARAAGMHLILGTQRPSVDVITGLIKANVPSRIAFTVASQTDSRVVLDMSGAEKLIGRGDMLYAPVGSMKPQRVQGAFVSEKEVLNIVDFIKRQSEVEYSTEIMANIEKEAERCDQKGKKGMSSADDDMDDGADPMLRQAIELAIDSGKISTSLIQRRLSLGYGRAAKLIDEMESRGFVSPPEGQKPRNVLITREQYMEMVLSRKEDLE